MEMHTSALRSLSVISCFDESCLSLFFSFPPLHPFILGNSRFLSYSLLHAIFAGPLTPADITSIFPIIFVPHLHSSSDFLSNLLVLLLRILNSGISDSGLLAHLSEATAGSLNGVGHSTAYEEISTYTYVRHMSLNLIIFVLISLSPSFLFFSARVTDWRLDTFF